MDMLWILAALVGLVLAAVGWVIWRAHREGTTEMVPTASTPVAKRSVKPTWGKVLVVANPLTACETVLQMDGRTFPNAEAPRLPLPTCNSKDCKCYYIPARERRFRTERRTWADRRTGLRYEPGQPGDRRSGKDRRHHGHYDWDETI
jgi:hypothetical protein